MEIDFIQDYKNLTVPELVKVARSPWDYLPEAVTAAQLILKERGITVEEIAVEEWNLAQKEMADALDKKRFGDYFEWLRELLGIDSSNGPTEKWFGFFVVLYSLYYAYNIYESTQTIVYFARCEFCKDFRPIYWDVGISIYSTIGLFLVLKQNRLGWSLLCIQAIAMDCIRLFVFFRFYMRHIHVFNAVTFILPFVAYTGILLFLFRPYILQLFQIEGKYRDRVLLIAAGVALVMVMSY